MTHPHPGRPRPSVGISTFVPSLATTVEVARAADRAGLDTAWTGEFNDRSAIVALADMAHHTSQCRIGSSIAYAVGRSPLILANEARGLDELSGGRLVLGLGTGTKGMQKGWHGERDPEAPATRLEELLPLLRKLWRLHEEPVRHAGRFYSINLTATADVPPTVRERIPVMTSRRQPPHDRNGRPGVRRSHLPPHLHQPVRRGGRAAWDRARHRPHRARPR